jgi:phage terminase small subunit
VGRPPKPLEQKRRTGRSPGRDTGGRKLPEPGNVVALPPAAGIPPYPADLGIEGRQLWDRAWSAAITWLSPDSDGKTVEEACFLADALAVSRVRYRATTDPADARALVALSKQFLEALSALGFTPTARARLGVAEVKRVSELEKLVQKRQERNKG